MIPPERVNAEQHATRDAILIYRVIVKNKKIVQLVQIARRIFGLKHQCKLVVALEGPETQAQQPAIESQHELRCHHHRRHDEST